MVKLSFDLVHLLRMIRGDQPRDIATGAGGNRSLHESAANHGVPTVVWVQKNEAR